MRLAVIFTGGTIACRQNDGYIGTSENQNYELLKVLDPDIEVKTFSPYFILSEQLDGELLTKLIHCVGERLGEGFDGIIVAHGTDTLQYSAAALALAFGGTETPIVLVSSNYVLTDSRANGSVNFEHAVKFIREGIGGVYVSYRNTDSLPEIHRADQLLAHDPYSDDVRSYKGRFGYFDGDKFVRTAPSVNHQKSLGKITFSKTSPVLRLNAYAGMMFPDTNGVKAVLLSGYHSGTLPTESEDFVRFCKTCREKQIPLCLVGMPAGSRYESTRAFEQLGIEILPEVTPIYAYVSLWAEYTEIR
ncbi:MAG: asparaginase [Ruminococcus sp.]|nr:asparaginase [Ruminococcus sp.]